MTEATEAAMRAKALGLDAVIDLDGPRRPTELQLRPARMCDCVKAFAANKRVQCADYCDWRFIVHTWLHANRSDPKWKNSPSQIYFSIWRDWLNELANRKDTQIIVLSDPARDHRIVGWMVHSPSPPLPVPVVHFVFVRDRRGEKLFWHLLGSAGITKHTRIVYTCAPKSAKWLASKFASATHVPMQEFLSPR